jgi:hypothetical protein
MQGLTEAGGKHELANWQNTELSATYRSKLMVPLVRTWLGIHIIGPIVVQEPS